MEGKTPSIVRAAAICDSLGLEFYVGPPRPGAGVAGAPALPATSIRDLERSTQGLVRLTTGAGGDPIPDDLWPVLAERRGFVAAPGLADADALAVVAANDADDVPGARPVGVFEARAAAGGGTLIEDAPPKGRVWFRRDWLDQRALDPTHCVVIGVEGESMEPELKAGSSILVDRARTEWRAERIYVVRTADGLIVKRAGEAEDGDWLLISEHPSYPPIPFPDDAEVVGQVIWVARSLLPEAR